MESRVLQINIMIDSMLIRHRVRRPPWNDYQQIHTDPLPLSTNFPESTWCA